MGHQREIEIALCLFREANDALIVFDPRDRRIIDVNPTTLRLTGFERKVLFDLKIADLISAPDPNDFKKLMAACQQTGFFHSQEGFYLSRLDRRPIPVNVSVSRLHTSPEPLGLVMIRNVSPRKKVEEELRRAHDDLESKVRDQTAELAGAIEKMAGEIAERVRIEGELRQAKEAAEQAGRVKDRFFAVLSHELRTPLTPVLAVTTALLNGDETPPNLRPTLEMIRRSISLEARLIDDLLDVMRAERGRLSLELEQADAHTLIEQAIELCRHETRSAGVRIVVAFKAFSPRVEVDSTRIRQVVWNLILNAVKCTEEGGTIVIETRNIESGRLVVSVIDDGRGIDPEVLPMIFEPFEQGQTPMGRRIEGLGLGLSISRSIIQGHGGHLNAQSAGPGRGATFTFDLPVAPERAHGSDSYTSPWSSTPESTSSPFKILLVDDNKIVLRFLSMILEMKGHHITSAIDLTSARAALDQRFDLLISDIELPDGSGLDLMRELRGRLPGIAVSGFGAPEDIELSLEAGFAMHLTKPIESSRLESAIHKVVAAFVRERAGVPLDSGARPMPFQVARIGTPPSA